jgi:hypothetical protein
MIIQFQEIWYRYIIKDFIGKNEFTNYLTEYTLGIESIFFFFGYLRRFAAFESFVKRLDKFRGIETVYI